MSEKNISDSPEIPPEIDTSHPWHAISSKEVFARLDVDPEIGLSSEEVIKRQKLYGPNHLPESPPPSLLFRIKEQFADITVLTLLVAAFVSGAMAYFGEEPGGFFVRFGDPLAIFAIVSLNAALGLIQDSRATRALAALKEMSAPHAHVRRDGKVLEIMSSEVVPGDILLLEEGSAIPADMRLIKAYELTVAEAALTGESVPVEKRSAPPVKEDAPLAERNTVCYLGTDVIRGKGEGIVFSIGAHTQLGQIAGMLSEVEAPLTPLQNSLHRFGKIIVFACLGVCALVFLVGAVLQTASLSILFLVAVSLAVAAIPEGLPAITTIALALGTQRMARRRALVRRLPAVETLGCAEVICSDKTGTLTSNAMAVRRVWTAGREWKVLGGALEGKGVFEKAGKKASPTEDPDLLLVLWAAGSTQGAKVYQEDENTPLSFSGDPTDVALLVLGVKGNISRKTLRVITELPFSSERLMTTTLVEKDGALMSFSRGATERLLSYCNSIQERGISRELLETDKEQILAVEGRWASDGMRIIGMAYRNTPPKEDKQNPALWEKDMCFLGLAGIIDPPRPEVLPAITEATQAGIRVMMITGDHPATARAIARELGMWNETSDLVLSGKELDALSQKEFSETLPKLRVVARATPANKLRVIETFSQENIVVAMTGDGVNDAPAVKAAPIGVAMGKTGTDVTKEAADLVLADDNFATIVAAVEEGRAIYANIRKFVFFLLSANAGLVLAILFTSFLGWPVLLTPIQLLWINLITNGLPALALGVEPPDPDQMTQAPRKPTDPLLTKQEYVDLLWVGFMFALIGVVAFLFGVISAEDAKLATLSYEKQIWQALFHMKDLSQNTLQQGQSLAFFVLALGPIFHSFNCRSKSRSIFEMNLFSNPALWGAAIAAVALLGIALYVPFLQPIFRTPPLSFYQIFVGSLFCFLPLLSVEIAKLVLRKQRIEK